MGLGHRYITKEYDLSEFARIQFIRSSSFEEVIGDTKFWLQSGLDRGEPWDDYFDLRLKFAAESIAKEAMQKSNYHRYLISIIEGQCLQGRHVKVGIHCYLHPFYLAKESFFMEFKSSDFVELP